MARGADGKIWIGTYGGGLVVCDDCNWIIYNKLNSGLWYDYINALAADNDGNIWISLLHHGLNKFTNNDWSLYMPNGNFICIAVSETGTAWFGGRGGPDYV